jgi:hypothetical protein
MYFFDHKLNVVLRNSELKKSILFILLSAYLMYVVAGLSSGVSVFRISALLQFWNTNKFFLLASVTLGVLLYVFKNRMKYLYLFYILYCGIKTFTIVLTSFHLVIIVLLFVYILAGAYFFILTSSELIRASYFPQVHRNDLFKKDFLAIDVLNVNGDYIGDVTNFDSGSCFVRLQEKVKNITKIQFKFEGNQFKANCKVVATSPEGFGLSLFDDGNGIRKWSDLYRIFKQRGYEKYYRGE